MRTLYSALAGFWLGAVAFFTFVVPEAAFAVLSGRSTGLFLAEVFPRFYAFSSLVGALTVASALLLRPRGRWQAITAAIALAVTVYAWLWLLPAVNRAIGTPAFGPLHGLSFGLDFLAMLLVLIGLVANLRPPAR